MLSDANWLHIYSDAYLCLNTLTPMAFDCGRLCGARCCQESESSELQGMYLFPNELAYLQQFDVSPDWWYTVHTVQAPVGKVLANEPERPITAELLCCHGQCPRELRPLACRVFPLTPYIDRRGRYGVALDPRGWDICPIHKLSELQPDFINGVMQACRPLLEIPEGYSFIWHLSRALEDIYAMGELPAKRVYYE